LTWLIFWDTLGKNVARSADMICGHPSSWLLSIQMSTVTQRQVAEALSANWA